MSRIDSEGECRTERHLGTWASSRWEIAFRALVNVVGEKKEWAVSLSGVERHLDTWHQARGVTPGMVLGRPGAALHGPCGTLPAQLILWFWCLRKGPAPIQPSQAR